MTVLGALRWRLRRLWILVSTTPSERRRRQEAFRLKVAKALILYRGFVHLSSTPEGRAALEDALRQSPPMQCFWCGKEGTAKFRIKEGSDIGRSICQDPKVCHTGRAA